MEQFRAAPRDTLVLEDSVPGILAARAAGARVVGFTGGSHTFPGHADMLTEAGAETVIRRLNDLAAVADAMTAWAGIGD
jgi:beta-phosphoglucomutase-like phosphatase (HAD superfamily)